MCVGMDLMLFKTIGSVSAFCDLRDQIDDWVHSKMVAGVDSFSVHDDLLCGGLLYVTATKKGWVNSDM